MPNITLPDGQIKHFEFPITPFEIAKTISVSLAKAAIAARVNGAIVDMTYVIEQDSDISLITKKQPEGLEIIRHSTAHLLAHAVKALFPDAQVTIGPVIDEGFYYDFAYKRPFTPDDLEKIEAKMKEFARQKLPIFRRELSRDAAIDYFRNQGELYKAEIIESIPENEVLSLYKQGEFEDLCRGPHAPSTHHLEAFKLTKLAGAYWRGDSSNKMLQRIYGTAWPDKKQLEDYLFRIEEAEKRDHRKLGKSLDLFHFQDIAPGMVFWHSKGWTIYQILEHYIRDRLTDYGYQEIKTPQVVDKVLWEKSGHWDNFSDNMFFTETENRSYAVKPMSCPCHVQIFNHGLRSYRELPIRFSEFGNCHRCEPSGSLHGLMRVRNMVQDDGHIFCTEDQIQAEVAATLDLIETAYQDFGFNHIVYRLALRPEKRVGSEVVWDKAEQALANAMKDRGIEWIDSPGEGAFYGPKIECSLTDCLGRIWQCGTIQIDFSMPERLEANFINETGERKVPVMIHRAVLGSLERFLGILIEHYAGKFPLWLAPVQVAILNITDKQDHYSHEVAKTLQKNNIRTILDLRNEKIGFKIREHTLQKIPYLIIIGDKEQEHNTLSVRSLNGTNLGNMTMDSFCNKINQEITDKLI